MNDNNRFSKLNSDFIKSFYRIIKKHMFSGNYKDLKDKPITLKNPESLKFTGAVTETYDGSEEKTVDIPKYELVTTKANGLMSSGDKSKVDKLIEVAKTDFSIDSSYEIIGRDENDQKLLISQGADNKISQVIKVIGELFGKLKDEYLWTANDENPAISQILVTNGTDNYFRKASKNHLKSNMGTLNILSNNVFSGIASTPTYGGYLKLFTINVSYWTGPKLYLTIATRGGGHRKVFLCFKDDSYATLHQFKVTPSYDIHTSSAESTTIPGTSVKGMLANVYLVKSGNNGNVYIWDLYLRIEAYGSYGYFGYVLPSGISMSSQSTIVSSLPDGYVSPTEVTNLTDIP